VRCYGLPLESQHRDQGEPFGDTVSPRRYFYPSPDQCNGRFSGAHHDCWWSSHAQGTVVVGGIHHRHATLLPNRTLLWPAPLGHRCLVRAPSLSSPGPLLRIAHCGLGPRACLRSFAVLRRACGGEKQGAAGCCDRDWGNSPRRGSSHGRLRLGVVYRFGGVQREPCDRIWTHRAGFRYFKSATLISNPTTAIAYPFSGVLGLIWALG
jgi:hypothetical protein